jgi:hypothetical protein
MKTKQFKVGDRVRWTDPRNESQPSTGTVVDRTKAGAYRPGPKWRNGFQYELVKWDGGVCRWSTQWS